MLLFRYTIYDLSFAFVLAMYVTRPKTATYENVMGLTEHKGILNRVIAGILCMGYQVRMTVMNDNEYGDAQNRKWAIMFASNESTHQPSKPQAIHGKGLRKVRTSGDA